MTPSVVMAGNSLYMPQESHLYYINLQTNRVVDMFYPSHHFAKTDSVTAVGEGVLRSAVTLPLIVPVDPPAAPPGVHHA